MTTIEIVVNLEKEPWKESCDKVLVYSQLCLNPYVVFDIHIFKVYIFLPCWISKPKSIFSSKNWIKKLFFKFCQMFFEFCLGLRTADFLFSICHIAFNTVHRDILSLGLLRSLWWPQRPWELKANGRTKHAEQWTCGKL